MYTLYVFSCSVCGNKRVSACVRGHPYTLATAPCRDMKKCSELYKVLKLCALWKDNLFLSF